MPRYVFHVFDGKDLPDGEGVELPDDFAARTEAIRAARSQRPKFWDGEDWMMRVDRAGGRSASYASRLKSSGRNLLPQPRLEHLLYPDIAMRLRPLVLTKRHLAWGTCRCAVGDLSR